MPIEDLVSKIILQDQFSKVFGEYEKKLTSVDAKSSSFQKSLSGIAVAGGVVAGGLVAANAALNEVTQTAVDSQKALFNVGAAAAAANSEFGDGVGTVESWTASVAATGDQLRVFGDQDVANATARLIDMTKRLGFNEEQMQTLLTRTGDLSAGKTNLEGGIERVTAAMRGEAESAEFLGLSLSETQVRAYAEAQGLVFKELTDLEKAQLRYNLFLEQTNTLQGRAAASAETLAGQDAELARLRERQIKEIGESLLPLRQGEIELLRRLAEAETGTGDVLLAVQSAVQAAFVTTGAVVVKTLEAVTASTNVLGAAMEALRNGENPFTAAEGALRDAAPVLSQFANTVAGVPDIYRDAYNQILEGNRQAIDSQAGLTTATNTTTDAIKTQASAAAAVADDISKEFEKAKQKQAQTAQDYNRDLADLEYEHGQRIIRINQDIARAVAEAAAEAAAARAEADADLAAGLAEIERDLQAEKAKAAADTDRDLARLRQDRRDAERDTAREISQVNSDLQQDLITLSQKTAQEIATQERERNEDIADVNQDLADDLEEISYQAQQDRLKLDQDYASKRLAVEQDFANQRKAINDAYESEYTDADPFRRKIMEYNRKEALSQLDQQEAAEKTALETQKNQAITELEDRVAREAEIRAREAEQKKAEIEREAAERVAALQQEAAERRVALETEAAERRAALEQKLADEIESNRRRQEELRASLAREQAERDAAAADARAKLEARHAEEMAQIQAQEAKKVSQAQEALTRENQNYQDRLASLQRSNQIEREEISQQLGVIEAARRASYDTQLSDAEAFMSRLRSVLSQSTGTGENRRGDTLPAGSSGRGNSTSITVNNYGVQSGFSGGVQTGRSVRDALNGY